MLWLVRLSLPPSLAVLASHPSQRICENTHKWHGHRQHTTANYCLVIGLFPRNIFTIPMDEDDGHKQDNNIHTYMLTIWKESSWASERASEPTNSHLLQQLTTTFSKIRQQLILAIAWVFEMLGLFYFRLNFVNTSWEFY